MMTTTGQRCNEKPPRRRAVSLAILEMNNFKLANRFAD